MISGMNHAVLYVRDATVHERFYRDVLDFATVAAQPGAFVFMRAPASTNHHDIAFFTIGTAAGPSQAGQQTVGMYHLAWQVGSLDELVATRERLVEADALVGQSDHGFSKSLYAKDPDGLEFEVMWAVPPDHWPPAGSQPAVLPLDLDQERSRFSQIQ